MNKSKNKKTNHLKIWQIIAYVFPTLMVILGAVLLNIFPMFGFRWYLIGLLTIIDLLLITLSTLFKTKKKTKAQITCIVLSILFGFGVTACDYLYYHATSTMSNISTEEGDTITSTIYVSHDSEIDSLESLKTHSLAVQPESSMTMYEMVIEGIEKADMSKTDFVISPYSSYIDAYEDFLAGEVDSIVLDQQAVVVLKDIYPEFDSQTKAIETFSRIVETASSSNVDVSKEPFTILINGVDIRSGNLNQAANADVIMLATFNPQTMKLSLNSIPRDTYLPVTCRGFSDKITHSGSGGVQCTISSLERAFNINIDYYVKVNFFAVVDLVDALGGIEVDVPFSFTEQDSHDSQGAITLEAGLQTLNGEEALALARHRKTLPQGDISRGLNQQLVIEGILKKAASSAAVWNVDKLLNVVGKNVQTNLPTSQMYGLFQLLTNLGSSSKYGNLSALNIQMKTIEGTGNMHVPPYSSLRLYFYLPYQFSMENTTRDINRILGKEDYPLPTNTFAFNANVPFEKISNDSIEYMDNDSGSKSYAVPEVPKEEVKEGVVPSFVGYTYLDVLNWCRAIDDELPDGYFMDCQFESEDGSEIQDDAIFVSSDRAAGSILSIDTLTEGGNPIRFVFRNPETTTEPEPPIDPEEPTDPVDPPVDPEEPTDPVEPPVDPEPKPDPDPENPADSTDE